jgi:hypothetical protein
MAVVAKKATKQHALLNSFQDDVTDQTDFTACALSA